MERLIRNLKKIREDRQVSYITLERATNIRAAKLREIEEGTVQPSIAELDRLLSFYKMNSQQLLRYKGKRKAWLRYGSLALVLLLVAGAAALYVFGGDNLQSSEESMTMDTVIEDYVSEASAAEPGIGQQTDEPAVSESEPEPAPEPVSDSEESARSDDAQVPEQVTDDDHADEVEAADSSEDQASQEVEAVQGENTDREHADNIAQQEEGYVLRFWGNIPYAADQLPELGDNDASHIRHVIPIVGLAEERPAWLSQDAGRSERYILNVGTADVWTSSTISEWRRLQEDGVPVIGLGKQPEVYEPYIIEVEGMKVGLLSLAGLIHEANQIAFTTRIGLPRAYDNLEVKKAVEAAKRDVDFLIVLIHWGERRGGEMPIAKQQRLARVIAESGGDIIIGNRSIRAQQFVDIDGVPVFYSLGRSISDHADDGQVNMVLDVHFSREQGEAKPSEIILRAGTMQDGVIQFAPLGEDVRQQLQAKFSAAWPLETIKFAVQGD